MSLNRFRIAAFFIVLLLATTILPAQNTGRRNRRDRNNAATVDSAWVNLSDSARTARLDSLRLKHISDSTSRADSLDMLGKSSLERPAFTEAKDSIIEDFSDGKRIIYYYGNVSVKYGDIELTADYMEYDLSTNILFARGTKDPATGELKGSPTMKQGDKTYEMREVRYNFDTRKASIKDMTTTEEDGTIHGKNIKMMPDHSINMTKGQYTVCDAEHPHYYLKLSAAKVTTGKNRKTVFGPANLVLADVPLPIGIPFGFIPKRPDRATGFLMPTFGEEASRGFYLRDAGMYFVLGQYFDLSITGDIYTLGSWAVDINSRYKVNYKFSGNFALTYSNDQTGEKGSSDFFQSKNFAVKWSHSQDSKSRPGTSFSASVNFSSPSNSRYNSTSVNEALQNQISSSISYSRNWNGKFNLSVNALHSQNSRDSSYTFTLPNVTFSVTRFYPFKQKNRVGKEKFYEKFSLGYSTTLQNKIGFKASEFDLKDPEFLGKFQNGMTHNFQIGLPNFTLFKYLNFTPSIQYGMNWFFRKTMKELVDVIDEETGLPKQVAYTDADGFTQMVTAQEIQDVRGKAFSSFGVTQTYSGSISMSTRLYGMFNFGKHHKLQAIRHVISPSMSFNFSPEKANKMNGYRSLEYVDVNGKLVHKDYNIYEGQVYSAPGRGRSGTMSLSIGNNLEAKVRDFRDTTGTGTKKIKLIDNLNINTGYNFLADSLKMNNVGISMNTSIFGRLGISANANFDPYAVNERGVKYNKFAVTQGQGLLRMTGASASLSYSISGDGKSVGSTGEVQGAAGDYYRVYYHPVTGEYIPGGWLYYMNTNSAWSLSFNYSYSYQRSYQYSNNELITKHRHNQTLGLSGNVKLTPKLSINMSSGFDLMAMKITTTQLSASYDLHCFNIAVSWVPTGKWQSWSFRIAANAAALSDLLRFKKSSSYWDN
ncbi:MAG: LPS-assembly protein LptD [Bacteroidales bacterium]|nr:LPS-assembly protein LptD [Candidatus Cryptobacteroides caccocaballi]